MTRFGPVITAMVTPFDAEGAIDLEGAAELAEWLVGQGNDALVVTGSTGEASVLTDDEQVEVWRAVRAAVAVPRAYERQNGTTGSDERASNAT